MQTVGAINMTNNPQPGYEFVTCICAMMIATMVTMEWATGAVLEAHDQPICYIIRCRKIS
jgi:hypothetical protein